MAVLSRKQVESGQVEIPPARVPVPDVESVPEPVEEIPVPRVKRKPKPDAPWFILDHPDSTPSMPISAKFEIDGKPVEIDNGRFETQDSDLKDELVRRGYRYMNEEY